MLVIARRYHRRHGHAERLLAVQFADDSTIYVQAAP
jgi:hypothetical protein